MFISEVSPFVQVYYGLQEKGSEQGLLGQTQSKEEQEEASGFSAASCPASNHHLRCSQEGEMIHSPLTSGFFIC